MVFVSLRDTLNDWAKKRNITKFFNSDKVIQLANQYFRVNKKWPTTKVEAISFKRGNLLIFYRTESELTGLSTQENNLKLFLLKQLPGLKIGKIIYKRFPLKWPFGR